jgi:hypothetical protein
MHRRIASIAVALWLIAAGPAVASQATLVTPAAPLPMTGLAAFLNAGLAAVNSCNSGTSAPSVGGQPLAQQCWANTTASAWPFAYYDGAQWVTFGTLDSSAHRWIPGCNVGAQSATLSQVSLAAATTDHALALSLPTGCTRIRVQSVTLSNATGDIHTGTMGVFTATGGGGATIAADQAITVTTAAANSNNNGQALTPTNASTEWYTPGSFGVANTMQVRVGTAVAAAAVDVVVLYTPLP